MKNLWEQWLQEDLGNEMFSIIWITIFHMKNYISLRGPYSFWRDRKIGDKVLLTLGQSNFWELPKKTDGVCPSSIPSYFLELQKNGRGLSIVLVLIRHQFDVSEIWERVTYLRVCPSSVSSNFWELPKNWQGLSVHPFRPIFGSFQKMDGVCPSSWC